MCGGGGGDGDGNSAAVMWLALFVVGVLMWCGMLRCFVMGVVWLLLC